MEFCDGSVSSHARDSHISTRQHDLTVQTYRTGLDFVRRENNLTSDKGWDLIPKYVPSWKLPFTITTALFFLLSFTFHFLNATLLRKFYFRHLARCRTPTRWIEYFFSAPTMIILIAFALGIRDRAMLFAIAALIASTMPFGYWVETVGRPASADTWMRPLHERLLPFFLGHIPQGAAWIIIIVQLYDGSVDPEDNVPWWVFIVLWAEFILFFSFGAASALSQLYPPRYFFRGELLFQILSLVSKGLLGIILLSNVLMLSRFEDSYE